MTLNDDSLFHEGEADDAPEAPTEIYFAAKPQDELAADLEGKIEDFYTFVQTSGIFARIRKSYQAYYGLSDKGFSSHGLGSAGDEGELWTLKVNHYRSIVTGLLNMTTAQKASYEVRAANTDFKSQTQTILADGILDYYLREKHLQRTFRDAVELGLVVQEAYVLAEWNATSGEQYGVNPETGAVIYEGDLDYGVYNPLDVIKDVTLQSSKQTTWYIVRKWKNRFDLAAKYPTRARDILAIHDDSRSEFNRVTMTSAFAQSESDLIPEYHLYHKKTDAVPNGRYMIFLDSETVLFDGPIPYRRLPVHRFCPAELFGTPFGYSGMYDLLGLQDFMDILWSTAVTTESTLGGTNIWTKPGSGLTVSQLSTALNHWESAEKPESIVLAKLSPEFLNLINLAEKTMETLSGLNSTVRGNPGSELKSGAALAMVASQAVQFNSGLDDAYVALFEDVGTGTFEILQDFAKVPRIAAIMGSHNQSYMKEFKGDDINHVNRVVVDRGNALSRTTAGRIEMANNLLQNQKFDTADEYIQVVTTGKLEPLIENKQSQILNIRAENERLRAGQPVQSILTDNPPLHMVEHLSVLDDPSSRENPQVVQNVLAHVQEHLGHWRTMDPAFLQMRGIPPAPPPPPPPGMMPMGAPGPGPAPGPGGPPPGVGPGGPGGPVPGHAGPQHPHGAPPHPGVNPAPMNAQNPTLTEAHGVKGPRMPSLPKGAPEGIQEAYGQIKHNTPGAA